MGGENRVGVSIFRGQCAIFDIKNVDASQVIVKYQKYIQSYFFGDWF